MENWNPFVVFFFFFWSIVFFVFVLPVSRTLFYSPFLCWFVSLMSHWLWALDEPGWILRTRVTPTLPSSWVLTGWGLGLAGAVSQSKPASWQFGEPANFFFRCNIFGELSLLLLLVGSSNVFFFPSRAYIFFMHCIYFCICIILVCFCIWNVWTNIFLLVLVHDPRGVSGLQSSVWCDWCHIPVSGWKQVVHRGQQHYAFAGDHLFI